MTMNSEPRWLNDDEREAWIGLMAVLLRVPAAIDRQLRSSSRMSHFEYQVMVILSGSPNWTLTMSELANGTEGSLPRLSQVAARLEKAGWVSRKPDPDDGRTTLATLTEAGHSVLAAAAPGHVEEVRNIVFDHLTQAQVVQLAQITDQIMQAPGGAPDPRPRR